MSKDQVWKAYQVFHPRAVLDSRRSRLIDQRLREFPVETLVAAIEGNHRDPFCCGENADGREYHSLDLILRNADKIEQYAAVPALPAKGLSEAGRTLRLAREAEWDEAV